MLPEADAPGAVASAHGSILGACANHLTDGAKMTSGNLAAEIVGAFAVIEPGPKRQSSR